MERLSGCLRPPVGTPGGPNEGGTLLGATIAAVASSVGTAADQEGQRTTVPRPVRAWSHSAP